MSMPVLHVVTYCGLMPSIRRFCQLLGMCNLDTVLKPPEIRNDW